MTVVIISRHESTTNFLKEYITTSNISTEEIQVLNHLGEEEIGVIQKGSIIFGNLPLPIVHKLFSNRGISTFYMVSLLIPPDMRGKDLSIEELKRYASLFKLSNLEGEHITFLSSS